MLSLLAFDPGGTTGVARVWLPLSAFSSGRILSELEFEAFQVGGSEKSQGLDLALILAEYSGPIVVESFTLRKFSQSSDLLAPVRIIARIEQIIDTLENWDTGYAIRRKPVFFQDPALAKSTANDERMRRWGLWTPGKPHGNDAMRHAVTFLRRCKGDKKLRERAFGVT